jgi:hypothetical protein
MSVKKEIGSILKGVAKGLISIPFPPPKKNEEQIKLHWCEQCKKYHRVP